MNYSDEFLQLMTEYQGRIFAFLLSLLGDVDQANEVLQEVNLVLWRKSDDFQPGTDFKAWSFRVAHFQVMAFRQRQIRDRLVFDNEALEQVVRSATKHDDTYEERRTRLEACIEQLPERSRNVLHRFYLEGETMDAIAERLQRTQNAVGQLLFRIRKALIKCVSNEGTEKAADAV